MENRHPHLPLRLALAGLVYALTASGAFAMPLSPRCSTLTHPTADWIALVEKDPQLKAHAETLTRHFLTYRLTGSIERAAAEKEIFTLLADLRDRDLLRPVLAKVVHEARAHPAFPKIPGDDAAIADQLFIMLDAELYAKGLSPQGLKAAFKPWLTLAKEQTLAVAASGEAAVRTAEFRAEFRRLTHATLHAGTKAKLLNVAAEALAERLRMIRGAKKSVWIATWAMYGDHAGHLFADLLIEKFRAGVDVRILVDGLTSERIGYRESVEKLRNAGVPVIQWRSEANPYYGQHRKFILVDQETPAAEALAGGRNFGDDYLHTGTKPDAPKWRDTDILYSGTVVHENAELFGRLWNEQADRLKTPELRIPANRLSRRYHAFLRPHSFMGVIDHAPNAAGVDPIYLGLLKSIDGSHHSIDIANAYVILTPAMQDALVRARARGVRVRIFTNSATSVDEPVVSVPILRSLAALLPSGCEIYVKNGDTLHSKFAIFDQELSWVMSYNLHPRSLRYEGETANVFFDPDFAKLAQKDFEGDLAAAKRITKVEDLAIPQSEISNVAGLYFFDQL